MTLRDPSVFTIHGRGDSVGTIAEVSDIDSDGRVRITVDEGYCEMQEVSLTLIQTAQLAVWLSKPAVARLCRAATRAAYEGMPDSPLREDLIAALEAALGPVA